VQLGFAPAGAGVDAFHSYILAAAEYRAGLGKLSKFVTQRESFL
jgi:hypothetical protein